MASIFVDPLLADDVGTGPVGDPYGDLQYAFDQTTQGASGDRFNIKTGPDEILAATIDLTSYTLPTESQPLVMAGYAEAEDDGGQGGIDCNGFLFMPSSLDFTTFKDLRIHGSDAAQLLSLDYRCTILACEFDDCTNTIAILLGRGSLALACHFHNCSGEGLRVANGLVQNCYFKNGAKSFSAAIVLTSDYGKAIGNIISIGGASKGIALWSNDNVACHNSILSSSGTGKGIWTQYDGENSHVFNNLAEGFIEGAGKAFDLSGAGGWLGVYGHNAAYNNVDDFYVTDNVLHDLGDNEELGASPFAKSGADTFANRFTYFASVNTGNVHGGAYPSGVRLDKGAVQHADPAGGGTTLITRPRRVM